MHLTRLTLTSTAVLGRSELQCECANDPCVQVGLTVLLPIIIIIIIIIIIANTQVPIVWWGVVRFLNHYFWYQVGWRTCEVGCGFAIQSSQSVQIGIMM